MAIVRLLVRRSCRIDKWIQTRFLTSVTIKSQATTSGQVDGWLEELRWRGLIAQHSNLPLPSPGDGNCFYMGIDPTAPSLHLGNLVGILTCRHLLDAGFSGVIVIGGATARVGDPSFRDQAKDLLDADTLVKNLACLRAQIGRLFGIKRKLTIVNNEDWYREMGAIQFLQQVASHVRLSALLGRESVQRRLAAPGGGMNLGEFSYPLLQAYDFVHLYRKMRCHLQVGGSDQWGNMITGLELLSKVESNSKAGILTFPLLTTTTTTANTGIKSRDEKASEPRPTNVAVEEKKMGKSDGNAVWLSAHFTSPFDLFQYFLRLSDAVALNWLPKLTLLSRSQVEELTIAHGEASETRIAHRALAGEVVKFVHGEQTAQDVETATALLYSEDQSVYHDKKKWDIIVDALCHSGAFISLPSDFDGSTMAILKAAFPNHSNNELRTLIKSDAVYLNGNRIESLHGQHSSVFSGDGDKQFALLRVGKRYFLLRTMPRQLEADLGLLV